MKMRAHFTKILLEQRSYVFEKSPLTGHGVADEECRADAEVRGEFRQMRKTFTIPKSQLLMVMALPIRRVGFGVD